MSEKWYAIDRENEVYFGTPHGYNKGDYVHDPKNPFPHMFIFEQTNDPTSNLVLIDDFPPGSYTDITENVYEDYKKYWDIKD